jgi:hypothetical protein
MEHNLVQHSSDLERFMEKFQPSKFKLIGRGVEIRGIVDIHGRIGEAKELINSMSLKLVVFHTAEMLTFRGFEVNNI